MRFDVETDPGDTVALVTWTVVRIAAGAVATLAVAAGLNCWALSGDDEPFTVSGYKAMRQKPRDYLIVPTHCPEWALRLAHEARDTPETGPLP
ncbi:hypothetical protein ACWDR5_29200 [Streptomyces koyangensis]